MKQITTTKATILVVDVPEGSYGHKITWSDTDDRFSIDYLFTEHHRGGFIMWYKDFGGKRKYPKKGGLKLLGKANDLTEDHLKQIFPNVIVGHRQCFVEVLSANGIVVSNPHTKPEEHWFMGDDYYYREWQDAQSKVTNPLILIKT